MWRNDPITKKQKKLIESIEETARMNDAFIRQFAGHTKGEASDWIDENIKKQYKSALDADEEAASTWLQYGIR